MENLSYDTIIIGAGLAGISAARTLIQNGVQDVLVLEAQEQAGGRVRTEFIQNFPFDYGAQFIHGEVGNTLYDYAARNGLLLNLPSFEGEGNFYTQCGIRVDPEAVEEVEKLVETSLHNPDAIAAENIQEIFDSVKKEVHHDIKLEGLLEWHKNYQLIDNACHRLDELSVEAWNQYQECPGNYCQLVKGGFIAIVNHLLKGIPDNAVKCAQPVEKITWEGNNAGGSGVVVKTVHGKEYKCKHVIVTCSIGFLREHWEDFFQPQLPPDWLARFNCIGFGSITKIAMMFDEPFWEGHCKGFQFAWTDTHLGHSLAYKEPWYHYLTGFDVVQASNPAVLLGWVGSRGALYLAEQDIGDEELGEECVKVLEEFTGHPSIPRPFKTIRTRWHKNPYVRGAFSYRTGVFDPKILDPLGPVVDGQQVPSLIFAGEALDVSHHSTAHGAFSSGRDQAMKIVDWKRNLSNSASS